MIIILHPTHLSCHWQPIQSHQAAHASSADGAVGPCSSLGSNASQHVILHRERRIPRVLRLERRGLRQLLRLWLNLMTLIHNSNVGRS